MANAKLISAIDLTGKTLYLMVKRASDGTYLENTGINAGTFQAAPASPYVPMSEDSVMKGRYSVSESRSVWTDGFYEGAAYQQTGGSPSPVADSVVAAGGIQITGDVIVDPN